MRLRRERERVHGKENNIPLQDLIEDYRKDVKKSDNSNARDKLILERWNKFFKNNRIKYVSDLDKKVIKKYERLRLEDIVPGDEGKTISQRTANIDIKLLNAVLNHAWKYDAIAYNPIAKYPYAKESPSLQRYLRINEIEAILEEARRRELFDIFYAILTLGMRAEEACFLQYGDIEHKTVAHIRPKRVWFFNDSGKRVVEDWAPKWNKERRTDFGKNYIDDDYLQEALSRGKSDEYCFPRPDRKGQPFTRHTLYDAFSAIARATKILDANIHTLRHTHISYMVARIGLDKRITFPAIMDNVGISDLKTLMGYTKTVKGLAQTWKDPLKFPWQK